MNYANGNTIPKLEHTPRGIKVPKRGLQNGDQLSTALLHDGDAFADLFELWFVPCVALMQETNMAEPLSPVLPLFYENGNEAESNAFLERFTRMILGRSPYNLTIWPMCPHEKICAEVDGKLSGVSYWIRLRVKAVCILLSAFPDEVFAEGTNWFGIFLQNSANADYFEVMNGMRLPLSFASVERLFPRTLHNDNDQPCVITIAYQSSTYEITLPAHGFLRAVFSDKSCQRLIGIKGNISFNESETRNAVLQLPDGGRPALFMYHKQYRDVFAIETGGPFADAAADGQGGAVVLTNYGIYYTRNGETVREKTPPIRAYGAGNLWALLYADGTLKCNLHKKGGLSIERALAVVENGDYSLLVRDESGTWDCNGGVAKEISEEQFVRCMLERFCCNGSICERGRSSLMTLAIQSNGTYEAE